ncbi:MAG: hypothetical protein KDB27_16340 [Planctomycetales bacterium]|nr:hypothetical protein [Planctomycetales bacterium]
MNRLSRIEALIATMKSAHNAADRWDAIQELVESGEGSISALAQELEQSAHPAVYTTISLIGRRGEGAIATLQNRALKADLAAVDALAAIGQAAVPSLTKLQDDLELEMSAMSREERGNVRRRAELALGVINGSLVIAQSQSGFVASGGNQKRRSPDTTPIAALLSALKTEPYETIVAILRRGPAALEAVDAVRDFILNASDEDFGWDQGQTLESAKHKAAEFLFQMQDAGAAAWLDCVKSGAVPPVGCTHFAGPCRNSDLHSFLLLALKEPGNHEATLDTLTQFDPSMFDVGDRKILTEVACHCLITAELDPSCVDISLARLCWGVGQNSDLAALMLIRLVDPYDNDIEIGICGTSDWRDGHVVAAYWLLASMGIDARELIARVATIAHCSRRAVHVRLMAVVLLARLDDHWPLPQIICETADFDGAVRKSFELLNRRLGATCATEFVQGLLQWMPQYGQHSHVPDFDVESCPRRVSTHGKLVPSPEFVDDWFSRRDWNNPYELVQELHDRQIVDASTAIATLERVLASLVEGRPDRQLDALERVHEVVSVLDSVRQLGPQAVGMADLLTRLSRHANLAVAVRARETLRAVDEISYDRLTNEIAEQPQPIEMPLQLYYQRDELAGNIRVVRGGVRIGEGQLEWHCDEQTRNMLPTEFAMSFDSAWFLFDPSSLEAKHIDIRIDRSSCQVSWREL